MNRVLQRGLQHDRDKWSQQENLSHRRGKMKSIRLTSSTKLGQKTGTSFCTRDKLTGVGPKVPHEFEDGGIISAQQMNENFQVAASKLRGRWTVLIPIQQTMKRFLKSLGIITTWSLMEPVLRT